MAAGTKVQTIICPTIKTVKLMNGFAANTLTPPVTADCVDNSQAASKPSTSDSAASASTARTKSRTKWMNMDNFFDADERHKIAALNGFRLKTYGDERATHAMCRHGIIVAANAEHHTCLWTMLVSSKEKSETQPKGMSNIFCAETNYEK